MAKVVNTHRENKRKKRPGTHSKNASNNQVKFKKKYRGQGRK